MLKNLLIPHKYRPKSLDDIILLPRVRGLIQNGVKQDYIFYGLPGCGKTTLSRIISELYSSITITETSVDVLRGKIEEFCSYQDMGIDKASVGDRIKKSGFDITNHDPDNIKVVFLDEFDDISKTFQEGLKSFMERDENSNVRFIATSNSLSYLPALKSRFNVIDFNAQNSEEENYLKKEFAKRLKTKILVGENFEMSNEEIIKLVNKYFPDFRGILNALETIIHSGNKDINGTSNIDLKLQNELFNHIINKSKPDVIYHFIMDNIGADKIDDLIRLLGRPFFNWILLNQKDYIVKLGDIMEVVTEYGDMLPNSPDPLVLGIALINKIQKI